MLSNRCGLRLEPMPDAGERRMAAAVMEKLPRDMHPARRLRVIRLRVMRLQVMRLQVIRFRPAIRQAKEHP